MQKLHWFRVCLLAAVTAAATEASAFNLTILHVNDFHARFEETNVYSSRCSDDQKANNKCYGGFARLKTAVDQERAKADNTLYLSAGDYFQGTIWYTVLKWRAMADLLTLIPHDAMSFGNHEFDDGIAGVVPFVKNVPFPVLAANIDDSLEPTLSSLYHKSTVVTKAGRKIGIVGFLTPETHVISNVGHLKIGDEVEGVRKEARRLRQEEGVEVIIALGHSGFLRDQRIAREVEEVDVVVGGHTNTFLYTGNPPSTEQPDGDYPSIVTQASGKQVPVVQAYCFGKYLGVLHLSFNEDGKVVAWGGNPRLLDGSIPQDEGILKALQPYKDQLEEKMEEEVGKTYVFLDGSRKKCRYQECNLGDLEADAMVNAFVKYPDDEKWSRTSLAVQNGGGIRASISHREDNGSVTMEDVLAVAPFQNTVDLVELSGKHVREMFEHSIQHYDPSGLSSAGRFLQVSGFVVVYDINLPPGHRVVRLQARCLECSEPAMEEVQNDKVYRVAMTSFLAGGGDGYEVIKDNKITHLTGPLDSDVLVNYMRHRSPIYQGTENRILFIDSLELCGAGGNQVPSSATYHPPSTTQEPESSGAGSVGGSVLVATWSLLMAVMVVGLLWETF